jgi:amino acid permease
MSEEKKYSGNEVVADPYPGDDIQHGSMTDNSDDLQRHLGNRQIQLIAIGGSIGTALFVSIGGALNKAGKFSCVEPCCHTSNLTTTTRSVGASPRLYRILLRHRSR